MTDASTRFCMLLSAGCALAACGSSSTPLPDMPSFAKDVQPILAANCTRCHGAGGMLNPALNPDGTPSNLGAPSLCYLTTYDDQGDCTVGDGGVISSTCKRGAHYCATPSGDPPTSYIEAYAITLTQDEGGMPPLPAPPLSARDKEVLKRWLENPIP